MATKLSVSSVGLDCFPRPLEGSAAVALTFRSPYSLVVKAQNRPKAGRRTTGAHDGAPVEVEEKRVEFARSGESLTAFDGPRETIAASVPKKLVQAVREMVGARGFSQFVSDALARETIRRKREEFVRTMEAEDGPADPELVGRYRRLFSR
jgi:hypothetical protein